MVHDSKPISQVARVFSQAAATLSQRTSVPLRFPSFMRGLEAETELYVVVQSADRTGYVVVLGATPDCQGQHVCSYGTFIGTSQELDQIHEYSFRDQSGTRVTLAHGIKGTFYETQCAAYCSDSKVVWSEGNYHYIIGIKGERKADLVRTINSAILAGLK